MRILAPRAKSPRMILELPQGVHDVLDKMDVQAVGERDEELAVLHVHDRDLFAFVDDDQIAVPHLLDVHEAM